MSIRAKDFIETAENLIFAVVAEGIEEERVLCFLRYQRDAEGLHKLETQDAQDLLATHHPQYLFYSKQRDVKVHGVPLQRIQRHFCSITGLQAIFETARPDAIQIKLRALADLLNAQGIAMHTLGITGSLLIGAQHGDSDIDLVIYGRESFQALRRIVEHMLSTGQLDRLSDAQWREAYDRRGCSLTFEEYLWHERRKYNKASISGTKIDFSLICDNSLPDLTRYTKIKPAEIIARIVEDRFSFDHPARYLINHPKLSEIVSFTPTFAGQAQNGESVIARGIIEASTRGARRLVIGSSREAPGEYIKIARPRT